jgi:MFS family permease
MQRYFGLTGRRLNAAVYAVSCLTGTIFGYNQAVAGGVLTTLSFQQQFPQINTVDTKGAQQHHKATIQGEFCLANFVPALNRILGTVVALYTLCGIFGAIACTFFGDMWGRRKAIFLATVIQLVGVVLMGTSFELAQFIVSRIVLGLGTG